MTDQGLTLAGWITAFELPALAGLFWLVLRLKREGEETLHAIAARLDQGLDRAREALAEYKLEVAKTYASLESLRSVEERLTAHLLRIEAKLDARPER